jgi:acyl dehydratase
MTAARERLAGLAVGQPARPLVKVAHNAATESENKIHSDAEARRLGLKGGLVPGVTLYAYLTELALPLLGPDWLRHGECAVRFVRPVYEGEALTCTATPAARTGDGTRGEVILDMAMLGPDGAVCVPGTAQLRWGEPAERRPEPRPFVARRGPSRRPLTPTAVPVGEPLASRTLRIDAETVQAYADEVGDPNPWYRDGSPFGLPLVPPGLLAGQPARLLRENFEFGPSVHAGSEIRHLGRALAGGEYRVDATIVDTFEKRGNHYLVADVLIADHTQTPVMQIMHTSIFHFAPRTGG